MKVDLFSTTTTSNVVGAAAAITAQGGGDLQSSALPAMHHVLTGGALAWPSGALAAHTPAAGRTGGVDLRAAGSMPVVVAFYAGAWHDAADVPYAFAAPDGAAVKQDFASAGARFVGVSIAAPEGQADGLSDATRSAVPPSVFGGACGGGCCTGVGGASRPTAPGGLCRLDFLTGSTGAGLATTDLIKGIQALAFGGTYDVTVALSNDPADGSVDATKLLSVKALDQGDAASGCAAHAAKDTNGDGALDLFTNVVSGTPVCFELAPAGALPAASGKAQLYAVHVDVLGMPGSVKLERRTVLLAIPPKG